ncbi:Hexosyltransferase [Caenorhabditis elegans]|uniref:Hexosyltransferase n=1 Tax=Caenorhabditis elegans TaxID=6239 RepID=O62114_CAEEL|nr:Hexosyltransferase [Caenorhabditis elegans]CAA15838.2 Hexosyltransferase [Caenorhabditis elegans]|eukprot:NP_493116.2 Hexosyltransferase [Caenorhabditis elegans]
MHFSNLFQIFLWARVAVIASFFITFLLLWNYRNVQNSSQYHANSKGKFVFEENCTRSGWNLNTTAERTMDYGTSFIISFADIQKTYKWLYLPETDIVLRSPDILMMVASRTDSFARRNVLRKTWMNKNYSEIVRDGRMKALFLVGMVSEDYRVRRIVMEEAKLYGDMVVIDLEDTYDDLPFKSLSLLLYAVSKAPEFKVIGKIDEDVMFFPDKLIPLLDGKVIDPDAAAFYGQLLKEGEPVIKKKDAHWYVPDYAYNCTGYPAYVAGPFYLATRKAAKLVLKFTKFQNFMTVEDSLITGILANDLGIPRKNLEHVYRHDYDIQDNEGKEILAWHSFKNNIPYRNFFVKRVARHRYEQNLSNMLLEINR